MLVMSLTNICLSVGKVSELNRSVSFLTLKK